MTQSFKIILIRVELMTKGVHLIDLLLGSCNSKERVVDVQSIFELRFNRHKNSNEYS